MAFKMLPNMVTPQPPRHHGQQQKVADAQVPAPAAHALEGVLTAATERPQRNLWDVERWSLEGS